MNITNVLIIAILLILIGCAPYPNPDQYGYHYTSVTPMGIMYRTDPGGVSLDPDQIDYNYSSVVNCAGVPSDANNLLVISTSEDVSPDDSYLVEGRAWQPYKGSPARIVINTTLSPERFGAIIPHEIVHILSGSLDHSNPMFKNCGAVIY